MGAPRSTVGTLAKASRLLDLLAAERELTAARLAELAGEPRSSVYRLLAGLQELEMVESGARRGTFRLGPALIRLGSAVLAATDERRAAMPGLEHLHAETGQTIYLLVPRGRRAVAIDRIEGREVQYLALELGGSLPLHAGAAPRALLAAQPPALWEEYVADGELERFTEHTPVTREQLFPLLEDARALGYAISDQDVTIGIASIAAPIFDSRGEPACSITISGVRPSILGADCERLIALTVEACREVSARLGHAAAASSMR